MSPRLARFLTAYLLMLIGSMMGWTLFCMRISAHPSPVAENAVSLLLLGIMSCMLPFVSAVLGPIPTSFRIALFLMRPPLGVLGRTRMDRDRHRPTMHVLLRFGRDELDDPAFKVDALPFEAAAVAEAEACVDGRMPSTRFVLCRGLSLRCRGGWATSRSGATHRRAEASPRRVRAGRESGSGTAPPCPCRSSSQTCSDACR